MFGLLFWLITLPFRLFFKLIGGILGMVFGLLRRPDRSGHRPDRLLVVVAVALIGARRGRLLSLLAPLLPVALLGLLVWAFYRVTKRPNPDILIISAPCRDSSRPCPRCSWRGFACAGTAQQRPPPRHIAF